jgi:hypothetical protein
LAGFFLAGFFLAGFFLAGFFAAFFVATGTSVGGGLRATSQHELHFYL